MSAIKGKKVHFDDHFRDEPINTIPFDFWNYDINPITGFVMTKQPGYLSSKKNPVVKRD